MLLHRFAKNKKSQLWVVKIGSQLIIDGGPLLIRALMDDTAELMRSRGIRVVWVSSGAIASAKKRLKDFSIKSRTKIGEVLAEKQALSAMGQPLLMELYNVALQSHGLMGSQVLLSYTDFRFKENRKNLTRTLLQLLDWNIVPILNENDAVATDEIQFGDNDQLSAMVASELKADRLIILTNVEGLYNKAPHLPGAELISYLPGINKKILDLAGGSKSQSGRGGMASKLLAAQRALKCGIPTTIARGEIPQVLLRLGHGETLGTHIGKIKV